MTARRNRPKRPVSEAMANEVLAEDPTGDALEEDASALEEDPEKDEASKPPRRLREKGESKGVLGRVEQLTRIGASVGVAVAALVGVGQYIEASEDVRREHSIEIVRDWQEDKLIERYTKLQSFVEVRTKNLTPLPEKTPDDLRRIALQTLGYNWMVDLRAEGGEEARQIEEHVDRLTLFFGQMETCINAELCNVEVLRAYFNTEARSFWRYFQGYARLRQEDNYVNYGAAVTALVARFEAMDVK